jgi:NFU1 iron-sulfur cluster scaffold homolog, mitochondrial
MASWFSKAFKNSESAPTDAPEPRAVKTLDDLDAMRFPEPRRVIQPTVLADEEETSAAAGGLRIRARMEPDYQTVLFMLDRPVLNGYSAFFDDEDDALAQSPLAAALFQVPGVFSVLFHHANVTLSFEDLYSQPWEDRAREAGAVLREHIENDLPIMAASFFESLPGEEEIAARIQMVIDTQINPGIASHSGVITLNRVVGNTVYITMGGGCQGCAASTITLRQGVHSAFRMEVPQVGAILDETDHAAGTNPYFTELPAGM